jgi:hypothetical protein
MKAFAGMPKNAASSLAKEQNQEARHVSARMPTLET